MYEQIITMLSATDYMSIVANDINALAGMFERYLSGADNLRIVSIILMLLAFILFLFLIIILYVKSTACDRHSPLACAHYILILGHSAFVSAYSRQIRYAHAARAVSVSPHALRRPDSIHVPKAAASRVSAVRFAAM